MAKLVSRLGIIADGCDEAVAIALQDTASFILTLIRLYVPVDTGWLRDSYKKETISPLHILVGTMVIYSQWVEFGSSRKGAAPHFLPAFLQSESYFLQAMTARLKTLG